MSVPHSAVASCTVVDSGLPNIHQQQKQYHHQHEHQQELYSQYYCKDNGNTIGTINSLTEQQQLMQQLTKMASSPLPLPSPLPSTSSRSSTSNTSLLATTLTDLQNNLEMSDEASLRLSAMAEQTADDNVNAETHNEWMRMSDGGRYGTPGAAGLEYQTYEKQQQQQQHQQQKQTSANIHDRQQMEPSLMDSENNPNNVVNCRNWDEELDNLSSAELYNTLKEYDLLQDKYHTVLLLPKESNREVTAGGRDGSAYVLRCLKIWYELPSDVLFCAMSLVDRFLDRMAVKPKHMACMIVASFHLANNQLKLKPIPTEELVKISQCGCTAGDLERMANVIENKLGVQMGTVPITSVSYLRIYYALFRNLAREIGGPFFPFYEQLIKLKDLENRLEILLCDVKTTVITPSTLALVLICLHLDFHIKESYMRGSPELKHVFDYILFLQQYMKIPNHVFTCGFSIVSGILSHYNGQNKQPYKQRLVWRLSSRTLRVLRPINRFSSDLPTIQEGISNAMDAEAMRTRTESISSEEEEDWPTSPVIPIFEKC